MTNSKRLYNKFAIVSYASIDDIKEICAEHNDQLIGWATIEHNRDKDENGNNKEWHRHLVLYCKRSMCPDTIKKWFVHCKDAKGEFANTLVQYKHTCRKQDGTVEEQTIDLAGATFYLVHEDKQGNPLPNKWHYSWGEVYGNNIDVLKNWTYGTKETTERKDNSFEILEQVMAGASPYELAKRYGRDFIMNYRKYADLAFVIHEQREYQERQKAEREQEMAMLIYSTNAEPTAEYVRSCMEDEIERLHAILRANDIKY